MRINVSRESRFYTRFHEKRKCVLRRSRVTNKISKSRFHFIRNNLCELRLRDTSRVGRMEYLYLELGDFRCEMYDRNQITRRIGNV